MQCDLCGSEKELLKTIIEDSTMNVCSKCSQYGKIIQSRETAIKHFKTTITKENADRIVENYLYGLKRNKKRSISSMKQTVAALKFIFSDILKREIPSALDIRFRKEEKIPVVLSESEVAQILNSVTNLKHKAILMTIYSSGIRLNELLSLQVWDIDFDRNLIIVKMGKGKKDRHSVFSTSLKRVLKNYLKRYYAFGDIMYAKSSISNNNFK